MGKQFPYKTNIDRVITDAEGNPISSGNPLPVSIEGGNADGDTQGTLDKIDARLEKIEKAFDNGVGNMQVTGSNVEDKKEFILNSESVSAGESTEIIDLGITNESRVFIAVNIDTQPWSLEAGWIESPSNYPSTNLFYPKRKEETKIETNKNSSIMSLLLSVSVSNIDNNEPKNIKEAIDNGLAKPFPGQKLRLKNLSDKKATVSLRVIRVWE